MKTTQIVPILLLIPMFFLRVEVVSAQATLPAPIRTYLDSIYPGWKLNATAVNCPRDFKRSLVAGDFDADGRRDYTVKFMSRRKGYIVAFLSRGTDYKPFLLEDGSASEMRSQGLSIARKGNVFGNRK